MEENVIVAGTFVAAVLEHMGYLTQEAFLRDFRGFFRDAGALIYLLGGVGAVFSIAMFGSFRAARYLVLGPALFWFLVGPTKQSEALWKLGGGDYLGELRAQGEGAARDYRGKVLDLMNQKGGNRPAEVAAGFYLFAYPISEFVNEFVNVLLKKENTEDLMANHKVGGLEIIASMIPMDSDYLRRIENFAAHCGDMVASAHSAATVMIESNRGLAGAGGAQSESTLAKMKEFHIERMKHYAVTESIPVVKTGFKEYIDAQRAHGTSSRAKDISPSMTDLPCGKAWELVAEETWSVAGTEVPRALRLATGLWDYGQARDTACKELTGKTKADGQPNECNLVPAIAVSMLFNHLTSMDTYGRVMAIHWNSRVAENPNKDKILTGPFADGFKPMTDDGGKVIMKREEDQHGREQMMMLLEKPPGPGKNEATYMWAPVATLTALHGMDHAMWVATRKYETVKLRQQIYTFSMQLPYYQGICLFLIAVGYPFMALIVLLPGRAHNFLNVPLAWLWVKSWDIGFAAVIILDKVMYEQLPSWELSEELRSGIWYETEKLPIALSQGYNFDPMGAIHIYYAVIAMVTCAIPALTGAVVMKARRGVLSSFIDAPGDQAKDRANWAGHGYSIKAQNQRNQMMLQIQGLARLSSIGGEGGVSGGMKGISTEALAMASAGVTVLGSADIQKALSANPEEVAKLPSHLMAARKAYLDTRTSLAKTNAAFERGMRTGFDPILGRHSAVEQLQEAYASSMAGGGGFELSRQKENADDELIALHQEQAATALKNMGKLITSAVEKGGGALLSGKDALHTVPGTMLLGNAAVHLAQQQLGENGVLTLASVKKAAGGDAFSDEEFLARTFMMNRFGFQDPAVRRDFEHARQNAPESLRRLYDDMYSVLSKPPTAGGPASVVDLYLGTCGGDRFVGKPGIGALHGSDNPNFSFSMPTLRDVGGTNWDERGRQIFGSVMQFRYDDYTVRLQNDKEFRDQASGVYEHETERLRRQLVGHYSEGVDKLIGTHELPMFDGQQMTKERLQGMSTVDLVRFGTQLANEDYSHIRRTIEAGGPGQSPVHTEMAMIRLNYDRLPEEQDMRYLAEHNPLLSLQLLQDWAQKRINGSQFNTSIAPGIDADAIVTRPGQMFSGK